MMTKKAVKVKWTEDVSEADYRAAEVYRSLINSSANASKAVGALKVAPIEKFKATDLLRASKVNYLKTTIAHAGESSRRSTRARHCRQCC